MPENNGGSKRSRSTSRDRADDKARKRTEGSKTKGRSKFEDVDLSAIMQQNATATVTPIGFHNNKSEVVYDELPASILKKFAPTGAATDRSGGEGGGGGGVSPNPQQGDDGDEGLTPEEIAARRQREIDAFVPMVPKSLLNLAVANVVSGATPSIRIGVGLGATGGGGGSEGALVAVGGAAGGGGGGGALALVGPNAAGQIATPASGGLPQDKFRQAREMRRLHISGFPATATREELRMVLLPKVHEARLQLLLEEGKGPLADEVKKNESMPDNEFDQIIDVSLNAGHAHPFAFIELTLADISDRLVSMDTQIVYTDASGKQHPLRVRRPKDYRPLRGVDKRRVVISGFPVAVGDRKLQQTLERYGAVANFQRRGAWTYAEFPDEATAAEVIGDINGMVVRNQLVVAHLLHDWIRVVLAREGIILPPPEAAEGEGGEGGSGEFDRTVFENDLVRDVLALEHKVPAVLRRIGDGWAHLRHTMGAVPVFPTRILVLLNCIDTNNAGKLLDHDQLLLDKDYDALVAAIEAEVERYGRVKRLIIPRTRPAAPRKPEPFVPRTIPRPSAIADLLPLQNPFAAPSSAATSSTTTTTGLSDEARQQLEAYDEAVAAEKQREADHRLEMQNYEVAVVEYRDTINNPVWGDRGLGRIFVEYETVDEAAYAQRQIAGKTFNERTVITSFLFEDILYPPEPEKTKQKGELDDSSDDEAAANNNDNNDNNGAAAAADSNVNPPQESMVAAAASGTEDID